MGSAVEELAAKLRDCYAAAPTDRKVASIHLFGIEHSAALKGVNKNDVAERAGISRSYGTELAKGANLAAYVQIVKPLV